MPKPLHIAVIGGGAAGMMAAITAARRDVRVTLLERQDRIGRKILATGNGHCNLSNIDCTEANYHGADPGFAGPVLNQFPVSATLDFFHALGVCTREEEKRIYPLTGQASTVLDLLRFELAELAVDVRLNAEVGKIVPCAGSFGLLLPSDEERFDRVVVTTGGKAMPQLGGDESGIDLLSHLGHSLVPVFPVLVPLKTGSPFLRRLKGVKVEAAVHLEIAGKREASVEGEVLFTEYGLSGPPIIQLSLAANSARIEKKPVTLTLDLRAGWSHEDLKAELQRRFSLRPRTALDVSLIGLLHKRLIPVILQEAKIVDGRRPVATISVAEMERLAHILKAWKHEITGSLSWNEAHVMAGGIDTRDFSPDTLESKRYPGLFAAGELLDVTGDCGGFNLQWAWSSGYVAGSHAATVAAVP